VAGILEEDFITILMLNLTSGVTPEKFV